MLRSSFLWKLYGGYVVLTCASMVIVGVVVSRWVVQESLAETHQELQRIAHLLQEIALPSLAGPPRAGPPPSGSPLGGLLDPGLQERLRRLRGEIGARLTVIRADGAVIADSDEDAERMENHLNRREILLARDQGAGMDTRYSHTLAIRMMYAAFPVRADGEIRGYVRAALPLTVVDRRLAHLRAVVALGAGIVALGALAAGLLLARRVTRPLRSLTRSAGLLAAGDYHQRVPLHARDEIGRLALAFNEMAQELERRMDAVNRERDQLLATLEGMVEGVVAVDGEEHVLLVNDAAQRMLHLAGRECIGKLIWEATRIREVSEILERTVAEGKPVTADLRLPTGVTDQMIAMHAAPLRERENRPGGAVLVLHDVTDLTRLERVRRDFVANVSHELRTPLTAIQGLVETLLDDETMEAGTRRDFLGRVREQSGRLAALITDLLVLSRVESGQEVLERELLDLRDPVAESVRMYRPAAEEKGLDLESVVPEVPLVVRGDAEALRQVVANLLDNAIKFTAPGGKIWVRVRPEGEEAIIEVEDTGMGIEPREQERIFERFYRVDKARSREMGGTGLGLSIVKHTVLALGGRVSVESVPGRGSTFRIALPLPAHSA